MLLDVKVRQVSRKSATSSSLTDSTRWTDDGASCSALVHWPLLVLTKVVINNLCMVCCVCTVPVL